MTRSHDLSYALWESTGLLVPIHKNLPMVFISRLLIRVWRMRFIRRDLHSPAPPEVGIFWCIQQPGRRPTILGPGRSIEDGERYGDYINYPDEHSRCLPEVRERLSPFFITSKLRIGRESTSCGTLKLSSTLATSERTDENPLCRCE
jgi:hypothetical protein